MSDVASTPKLTPAQQELFDKLPAKLKDDFLKAIHPAERTSMTEKRRKHLQAQRDITTKAVDELKVYVESLDFVLEGEQITKENFDKLEAFPVFDGMTICKKKQRKAEVAE